MFEGEKGLGKEELKTLAEAETKVVAGSSTKSGGKTPESKFPKESVCWGFKILSL